MLSKFTELFLDTRPVDLPRAVEAIDKMYAFCKLPKPNHILCKGLLHLNQMLKEERLCYSPFSFDESNPIATFHTSRGWGKSNRLQSVINTGIYNAAKIPRLGWCKDNVFHPVSYQYGKDNGIDRWPWQQLATEIWDNCFFCLTYKDTCIIFDRPAEVKHNDRGYHCGDGPAVIFRDGSTLYAYEGEQVPRTLIEDKASATIFDIHQGNSRKHILIDLFGLEDYMDLIKSYKIDVKGKFKNLYGFAKFDGPATPEGAASWEKSTGDYMREAYKDKEYRATLDLANVNGRGGHFVMTNHQDGFYFFKPGQDILTAKVSKRFLNKCDHELWKLLNFNETFSRSVFEINICYKGGEFYVVDKTLDDDDKYGEAYKKRARRDVCPSWVKVHMMRGTSCHYEDEFSEVRVTNGKFEVLRAPENTHKSLFGGCENVPSFSFKFDIRANTWEGLLQKWADLAFNWLGLCEDSSRMP